MVLITAHPIYQKYGVTVAELARWRRLHLGPTYYQLTPRHIRYDMADVDDWFHNPANAHLHDFPVNQTAKVSPVVPPPDATQLKWKDGNYQY